MRTSVVCFTLTAAALVCAPLSAQTSGQLSCTSAQHHQFDFWVGTWTVTNPRGQRAGENRITKTHKDCVLAEQWTSASGSHGSSFNIYDAATGKWHQTWVDDQGNLLVLDGEFAAGRMALRGQRPGANGQTVLHEIVWEPLDDGRVRQLWKSSTDQGETWQTVFDGLYEKKR